MSGKRREPKEVGANPASRTQAADPSTAIIGDVLSDEQLAAQRVAQAAKMKLDAQAMLAEAARLEAEAAEFTPAKPAANATRKTTKAKATSKKQTA